MRREDFKHLKVGTKVVLVEGIDTLRGTFKIGDWSCNTVLGEVAGHGRFVEWESEPVLQQPIELIHDQEIFNIEKLDDYIEGKLE